MTPSVRLLTCVILHLYNVVLETHSVKNPPVCVGGGGGGGRKRDL